MTERRFPVLSNFGLRSTHLAKSVPWSLLEPHKWQAVTNHQQDLERLAERGGLSPQEMWCVVNDKPLRERCSPELAEEWLQSVAG